MLRLVDLQQVLLHSTTVEKVQQIQQQHADVEKKHFALQFQEEIDHRKKEVQVSKESGEVTIKEDKGRKKQEKSYDSPREKDAAGGGPCRKVQLAELDQGKILDLIV